MRVSRRILISLWLTLLVSSLTLWADPGDVEDSHDYAGFPRLPGFVISDYDEDNPAVFDFPVARPLPIDSGHIEMVHVAGHRYIIRYEPGDSGAARTLLQTQRAFEKIAAAGGFTLEKTGAVGDVTETFVRQQGNRFIWVHLVPEANAHTLTIMESGSAPPSQALPPQAPSIAQTPPPAPPPSEVPKPPAPVTPPPAPTPPAADSESSQEAGTGDDDPLYTALMQDGHVALPIRFLPGKPDIDSDSKPVIERVVAILKLHPDLHIEIDGHTDNYGSAAENRYISTQRALSVKGMLMAAHISRRRLTAIGKGGSQPIADNDTAEGREKNRRIELVLPKGSGKKDASSSTDSAQDSSSFHPAAPNGMNYYPSSDTSSEADSSR